MTFLNKNTIGISAIALAAGVAVILFTLYTDDGYQAPSPSAGAVFVSHNKAAETAHFVKPLPLPMNRPQPAMSIPAIKRPVKTPAHISKAEDTSGKTVPIQGEIDEARLAEAEFAIVNNQMYEELAREILPTLSIQTHNPIWAMEYEAAEKKKVVDFDKDGTELTAAPSQGTLPAPQSGPFGDIQPPEGEIWLRIPPEYAKEHRDIMAENADLYREETGYGGPVTVTLWVGGRPYASQKYE